jgi:hypothetical protein
MWKTEPWPGREADVLRAEVHDIDLYSVGWVGGKRSVMVYLCIGP